MPKLTTHPTTLTNIADLRRQFLKENPIQIRYEVCHLHGWADYYPLTVDGQPAGYGAVKGLDDLTVRDTIFEFFLLPQYRPTRARSSNACWPLPEPLTWKARPTCPC